MQGRFYALLLRCATGALAVQAQTFTTLVNFSGPNGARPSGRLEQGLDGNFYGITAEGGAYSCPPQAGCGTIFRVTREGTLATLLSFNDSNGASPSGGLTLATDGNFYGTTGGGKDHNLYGSIFRITASGELTTLYGFSNSITGAGPSMPLVEAANGSFYGSTTGNGSGGTIFVITPAGSLTNLVEFGPGSGLCDSLVQVPDGTFYGATEEGGSNHVGAFFSMTPSGTLTTLYGFTGYPGSGPVSVVLAPEGTFFGTTSYGPGAGVGYGTIFKITRSGNLTNLHTFNEAEGYRPLGLVLASDGNLYGTTSAGGLGGLGSIYRITPEGIMTTLHFFTDTTSGWPSAAVFQATDGTLYGVTSAPGGGALFSFSLGLRPFVKTLPHWGKPGAVISLLGTDLAGATRVAFNGRKAEFKIISPTHIQATVPDGATTGWIEVVTPARILLSAGPFLVR